MAFRVKQSSSRARASVKAHAEDKHAERVASKGLRQSEARDFLMQKNRLGKGPVGSSAFVAKQVKNKESASASMKDEEEAVAEDMQTQETGDVLLEKCGEINLPDAKKEVLRLGKWLDLACNMSLQPFATDHLELLTKQQEGKQWIPNLLVALEVESLSLDALFLLTNMSAVLKLHPVISASKLFGKLIEILSSRTSHPNMAQQAMLALANLSTDNMQLAKGLLSTQVAAGACFHFLEASKRSAGGTDADMKRSFARLMHRLCQAWAADTSAANSIVMCMPTLTDLAFDAKVEVCTCLDAWHACNWVAKRSPDLLFKTNMPYSWCVEMDKKVSLDSIFLPVVANLARSLVTDYGEGLANCLVQSNVWLHLPVWMKHRKVSTREDACVILNEILVYLRSAANLLMEYTKFRTELIPVLTKCVASDDRLVRCQAAVALSTLCGRLAKDPRAVQFLVTEHSVLRLLFGTLTLGEQTCRHTLPTLLLLAQTCGTKLMLEQAEEDDSFPKGSIHDSTEELFTSALLPFTTSSIDSLSLCADALIKMVGSQEEEETEPGSGMKDG